MNRYRLVGIGLAALGVLGFSLRPILVKLSYAYVVDPVTLLALRMSIALPFFIVAALWARGEARQQPLTRRDMAAVAALGAIGYYAASFFDFLGLQYVPAGLGRLILFLYPTVVVVLSAVFLGIAIRGRDVLALIVTYLGITLVMFEQLGVEARNLPLGAALIFAGGATYSVYLVFGSQVIRRLGVMRFTAYAMTFACLCCIAQFLVLRPFSALILPGPVYLLMLAMAVFCTILPVFMISEALRRIGANHVALLGGLGPVFTILVGSLGLGEAMTLIQVGGGVMVLIGVIMVSLSQEKRKSEA